MADRRYRNANWNVCGDSGPTMEGAQLAVLMDIREELQAIRRVLECPNVQKMAFAAQRIDRRLAKKLPLEKGGKR
jgi:hypothetical protein